MIYSAYLEHVDEEKLYVVVSNNARNRSLDTSLAARITTTRKPQITSIVPIQPGEAVHGSVHCDDIELLYPEDVRSSPGAFSPAMMRRINDGLRAAFGL
ncbi:MAG: type II toxin-antitoxin system PemK/MazF family toxin [Mycolicibacterium sp.]|nr:type II toxin-antitoxin system PemK/MazF family toxin [Mycolicibacterium sp.]